MEHLLQCLIIHNIFKYIVFQGRQKALSWSKGKDFAFRLLQMYCYYKCSVALPHGVVGWFAVYDCGIS